ncbi:glycolipid transfer protein 2-like isoform X3 [Triticum dicoccoides]|uniref:glycolipid transfer protein 2-like isoform X3 n=1 Tax=Triticum dicoccoides TaxID=85692 RepID=UPI0018909D42|nr:glycolipid transfer protein 2-like isoform X3 [Triticum dicoccoides]XP_044372091.1 glycolipid transfer protein 2-like isoform X3 [Triticum aestivum]
MEREKMERGKSELRMAIEDLSLPSSGDGEYQEQQGKIRRSSTMDLLCVSNQLLRVLDAIGPTLLVLRQDIQQNVQRLQDLHARDSSQYVSLTAIVMEEVEEGNSKKTNSCSRAIIWLARPQRVQSREPALEEKMSCDAIGPTLLVLTQDIEQNVQRLQDLHARDSLKYASLTAMVTKEVVEGTSKKTNSCARAIIWLARSVNFSIHLLEGLVKNSESSLQEMVEEAYKSTLKPFHGWISSAAYKVALCLIPERDIFIQLLMGSCQDPGYFGEDVMVLVSIAQPLLEEINAILVGVPDYAHAHILNETVTALH